MDRRSVFSMANHHYKLRLKITPEALLKKSYRAAQLVRGRLAP